MNKKCDLSFLVFLDLPLTPLADVVAAARNAALGGATAIQLREEHNDTVALITTGLAIKAALNELDTAIIVNDSIDVASVIGAQGITLHKRLDLLTEARARLGNEVMIGVTTLDMDLMTSAKARAADFIATGPVFETKGKPYWVRPYGLDGLHNVVKRATRPIVAVGGVEVEHIQQVFEAAPLGIGVPISVIDGVDVVEELSRYRKEIDMYEPRLGASQRKREI